MHHKLSNMQSTSSNRLNWIDWMKVIGIYFIVYGHLFSIGNTYVYVFSVPLFFVISGFLCKHELIGAVFWKKLWYNLVLPMILLSIINFSLKSFSSLLRGEFEITSLYSFPHQLLLGFHDGIGVLWFIYTLIILKIIYQYATSLWLWPLGFLLFPLTGMLINHWNPTINGVSIVNSSNAIINVCMAAPFFTMGTILRKKKKELDHFRSAKWQIPIWAISIIIVYFCGKWNGDVRMYVNGYGHHILLFFIGGMAGTAMVFILSQWLSSIRGQWITVLSNGTIIILGFHYYLISSVARRILPTPSYTDLLLAAAIVLFFIPVIRWVEKYVPHLMGIYRLKSRKP